MWPILVIGLLIVAAFITLVAVVMLIVAAFKAIKAASPEGQLKSAEEAAEAAGEAADKAAEAYNNLVEALDGLEDKYKSLEEMTRGTEEWEKAVREVNQEVMDLIDQYPELAAFVDGSEGYLKLDIESDGVQEVLNQYDAKQARAKAASYAANMNVQEKKEAVNYKNLDNKTKLGNEAGLGW
jgi:hypothetical protein